jgi:hypothetical protein
MRLSEWRYAAPSEACLSDQVLAVLVPVLADLGTEEDPECWVAWGEDPAFRYSILAATAIGLVSVNVRVAEGSRAAGKLVRWPKVQVGELSVESIGGHRGVSVQVEGQVLKGVDEEAASICEYVRGILAAIDGRTVPAVVTGGAPRAAAPVAAAPAPKPAAKAAAPAATDAAAGKQAVAVVEPAAEKTPAPAKLPPEPAGPEPAKSGAAEPAPGKGKPKKAAGRGAPAPDKSGWIGPHPIEERAAPADAASAPEAAAPAEPTPPPAAPAPAAPPSAQPAPPAARPYAGGAGTWDVPRATPEPQERKRPRWVP